MSDLVERSLNKQWPHLSYIQTIKGVIYVIVTALLLYSMIFRLVKEKSARITSLYGQNKWLQDLLLKQKDILLLALDSDLKIHFSSGAIEGFHIGSHLYDNELGVYEMEAQQLWASKLEEVVLAVQKKGSYMGELHIGTRWLFINGSMSDKYTGSPLALLLCQDKTDAKELLELNNNLQAENTVLSEDITSKAQQIELLSERFSWLLNCFPFPVTIHEVLENKQISVLANKSALDLFIDGANLAPGIDLEASLTFIDKSRYKNGNVTKFFFKDENHKHAILTQHGTVRHLIVKEVLGGKMGDNIKCKVYFDTTDLGNAYAFANQQIEFFKAILDRLDISLFCLDHSFTCLYRNSKMETLINRGSQLNADDIFDIFCQGLPEHNVRQMVETTIQKKAVQSVEIQLKNTPHKWYILRCYPIVFQSNGNSINVIVTVSDISAQREQEKRFVDNVLQAEENNRLKTIFLSNLSHEIRTPMNGMLGFLDLLELDNLSVDQSNYLKLVRKSTDQLLTILNEILEFAQIETLQMESNNKWVEIPIINEMLAAHAQIELNKSGKTQIDLVVNTMDTPSTSLNIDLNQLLRIHNHLISNAIKFTYSGQIIVSLMFDESKLTLEVSDTGIGIKEDIDDAVYLPFTSFCNEGGAVYDGIGLGLTIVKGIVDFQKGFIEYKSERDKGTTFIVELPIKVSSFSNTTQSQTTEIESGASDLKSLKPKAIKVKKVLVVEDLYENAVLLKVLLSQLGVEVVHVSDGVSAIEAFYEIADFDLVLCDLRLPDISGFEVLSAIRRINHSIPVIANTAYVMNEDRRKCLKAGFNDYLSKPISREDLLKVLSNP